MLGASTVLLLLSVQAGCTMLRPPETLTDTFRQCLISQPLGLGRCVGVGAIQRLQALDSSPEFDLIDGITLSRDGQEFRDLPVYNFAERDPASFRTIVDSLSHVLSGRQLQWNMGFIYPGLAMRVAPSGAPGGVLEFVIDPHREAANVHALKEAGTARLLARQFLVPCLLGLKFNVSSLIPIIFGVLALLAKKAVVIGKLALIITSGVGLGSLFFGGSKCQTYSPGTNAGYYGGTGWTGAAQTFKSYPKDEYLEPEYRGNKDQLNVYPSIIQSVENESRTDKNKGRNFAWSEDDKVLQEKSA
ncbi:unnamed protein product [Acanthoscelides obtectus]|uniref:Osiris 10 n=1 Tax=Acanthoscelides obtectus TaxID=200917 RepID=A0A9P0MJV1_ACAOB|nr:unnamed protein product [Acanthoscelides obtectus]CAK1648144.1 hypothetical protein AOBTE_LOCUS15558 [Acanthoscelides obtectus]